MRIGIKNAIATGLSGTLPIVREPTAALNSFHPCYEKRDV
jgi:hypothetical protein